MTRSRALTAQRASALRTAMDRADKARAGRERTTALDQLATMLETDASTSNGRDASRFKALAETLKGREAALRAN